MKIKYIYILLALALFGLVLWGFIVYVPYYVNDEGLSMALYDTELRISAIITISFLFTAGTYILSILIFMVYPKLMDFQLIKYSVKTLPLYPIVSLIISLIFNLFIKRDEYDYASLGINFLNANIDSFSRTITYAEVVELGKSLNPGVGFYLVWVLAIVFLLEFLWYYFNFSKIFDIDEMYY